MEKQLIDNLPNTVQGCTARMEYLQKSIEDGIDAVNKLKVESFKAECALNIDMQERENLIIKIGILNAEAIQNENII
jgi:hypothetical protein